MKRLTNVQEVMDQLKWSNKQGCSICRPALEYYISMIYPAYEMENENLFLNEQMNATIQSDGTYAVVPQLYGGVLDADQLRKITNVAEKYPLTHIVVASDQRIHILGVREEELPRVWGDLNMPLRSSNENMVETIKTSVGAHGCRCDKQPSVKLAEALEQRTEFVKTPNRIKMGISACVHNGADATTKDIGTIKMNRGWEIYVGGSSDRNVRAGDLLCVVGTDKEAGELITGFIQYYRESANYLERTWQWIDRVGLVHIREALFDEEIRDHLLKSLDADVATRKNYLIKVNVNVQKVNS